MKRMVFVIIAINIQIIFMIELHKLTRIPKFCQDILSKSTLWETELSVFSELNDNVCFYGCFYLEYCPIQLVSSVEEQCNPDQCIYQASHLNYLVCMFWYWTILY